MTTIRAATDDDLSACRAVWLAIDRDVTGRDRAQDLAYELDVLHGHLVAITRGADVVGHAVVIHPTWWVPWRAEGTRVAPVVVRDPADATGAVGAAVQYARGLGA